MIAELRYKDGSKKELKISTLASRLKEVKGDVKNKGGNSKRSFT